MEFAIIGLISIFVVALFAANILPTLFNQTFQMGQADSTPGDPGNVTGAGRDLSSGDRALVIVFNTLAVVAYVLIPVALVFMIVALMRRSRNE